MAKPIAYYQFWLGEIHQNEAKELWDYIEKFATERHCLLAGEYELNKVLQDSKKPAKKVKKKR